jgi:hypothetical protein
VTSFVIGRNKNLPSQIKNNTNSLLLRYCTKDWRMRKLQQAPNPALNRTVKENNTLSHQCLVLGRVKQKGTRAWNLNNAHEKMLNYLTRARWNRSGYLIQLYAQLSYNKEWLWQTAASSILHTTMTLCFQ